VPRDPFAGDLPPPLIRAGHYRISGKLGDLTAPARFFDPALLRAPKPPRMARRLGVLITVKAAPNPFVDLRRDGPRGGISTSLAEPGWVRLYPINFRDLFGRAVSEVRPDRGRREYGDSGSANR
jgi:hypothetical protein